MIYFILAEEANKVKIGFTGDNTIDHRFSCIQVSSPLKLKILGIIPNADHSLERYLHKKFAKYKVQGEWFEISQEFLDFISELKNTEINEDSFIIPQLQMVVKKQRKTCWRYNKKKEIKESKSEKIKVPAKKKLEIVNERIEISKKTFEQIANKIAIENDITNIIKKVKRFRKEV